MKQLEKIVKQVLNEAAKVTFAGHTFVLKVDTNEDPQKKGVKVQFLPTTFGKITPTQQNDIAIELESRLEKGLGEYELRVERDRNLKDKTIIGFFIYIEYFDKIIRKALSGQNPTSSPKPEPEV
jgi:hypothetical protein|tara:strand:- start:3884 stop:4255 length:372 start_codon:yes stop_codon:yes gene_type:complete